MCSPQTRPSTNVSSMTPITVLTNICIYHKLLSKHFARYFNRWTWRCFPCHIGGWSSVNWKIKSQISLNSREKFFFFHTQSRAYFGAPSSGGLHCKYLGKLKKKKVSSSIMLWCCTYQIVCNRLLKNKVELLNNKK